MTFNTVSTSLAVIERPPQFDQDQGADYIDAEFREIHGRTMKAADIVTPVYRLPLRFHSGGVYKFRQVMEKSKTRVMMAYTFHLLNNCGYRGFEVFANAWLDIPGAHWLSNQEFRKLCFRAFNEEATGGRFNHTIWLAFDADEIWSYVVQADKVCYNETKKLPKNYKRNIHFMYEIHQHKGVPKYLRAMTETPVKPYPNEKTDSARCVVCNARSGLNLVMPVYHLSAMNKRYNRFGDDEE